MTIQPLPGSSYDEIARTLCEAGKIAQTRYGLPLSGSDAAVAAFNVGREVAAALCALFDSDPEFDYERFLSITITGKAFE